jgi:hypothetical protein
MEKRRKNDHVERDEEQFGVEKVTICGKRKRGRGDRRGGER